MLRIGESRIKLIFVAGCAELGLGLDEVHGLVAAMSIVAKQALARGHIRMRLVDGLVVILVAGITGFSLCLGQQGIIGRFVEGDVAFAATLILIRLVGMSQAFGTGQTVVTLSARFGLNQNGLAAWFVGIVAETALHVLITGMRRRGDGWVELLFMAGATQFRLGVPQDGGIVGTMREMAEIAFFLGKLRVRLHHRAAMIVMAGIARVGYGSHHQFGVCPRMRCVAICALPILERLMPVRHRRIRIGYVLPVAVPTDLFDAPPQLIWVRTIQIVAGPASAIAERLVNEVQAVHMRRTQASLSGIEGRGGNDEGGGSRGGTRRRG